MPSQFRVYLHSMETWCNFLGLIPTGEDGLSSIKCLMINTKDGSCKSFNDSEQAVLYNNSVCLDPVFDVLWRYLAFHNINCRSFLQNTSCQVPFHVPSGRSVMPKNNISFQLQCGKTGDQLLQCDKL